MKCLKVLWLVVALAVSGCSSARTWDKAEIEQKVMTGYNEKFAASKTAGRCTKVSIVPDGENRFSGYATFSDGSTKNIEVIGDPKTGEIITR